MTTSLKFEDFILLLIDSLEVAGIEYLIGGAVAAWAWGEPRATQDIDMVVDLPVEAIGRLSRELGNRGMPLPAEIILKALLEERADVPVSPVHQRSGFKADLYLLKPGDALRHSAFERRQKVDFGPPFGEVYLHSPEDLILYKLLYFTLSRQTKHARDIAAILSSLKDRLDYLYIQTWVERLGLAAIWEELRASLDPGD